MWDALANGDVLGCFQFDSSVGAQAAKKIKPQNPHEMADANGLMRLMTSEKVLKLQWRSMFDLRIIFLFGIKKWTEKD